MLTRASSPGVCPDYRRNRDERDGAVAPGIATVRLRIGQAQSRVNRGNRKTQWLWQLAAAAGMPTRRFNELPAVDRIKIRWAYLMLTAPSNVGREPDPVSWTAFEIERTRVATAVG